MVDSLCDKISVNPGLDSRRGTLSTERFLPLPSICKTAPEHLSWDSSMKNMSSERSGVGSLGEFEELDGPSSVGARPSISQAILWPKGI